MIEPVYSIDPSTGLLIFTTGNEVRVIGETDLAVVYSPDPECPCLYKHGPAHLISAYATKLAQIDPDIVTVIIPWEAIKKPRLGPIVLNEINNCLAISGRVGRLCERLDAMHSRAEASPVSAADI